MTKTYLVECYWPAVSSDEISRAAARVGELAPSGLRWIDAILVPDDEIVLCLIESSSAESVAVVSRQAGLPSERVVEAARLPGPRPGRRKA